MRALIAEPYLSRGRDYFRSGVVNIIKFTRDSVKARIIGTRLYTVVLTTSNKRLDGTCSCPAFNDFGPCKHMAAVCYAIIDYWSNDGDIKKSRDDRFEESDTVRKRLMARKKEELVDFIISLSFEYPELLDNYDV